MSKIALIDADSLLYFEMGKPTLEEAIEGIDQRIQQILIETEAQSYIGYLTLGKCFRYEVAKSKPYKHNRKGGAKPPIFYALKEYIQQKWGFYGVPGLEADDLVAIFKNEFQDSVICSPDKDVLKQLPGKHYNYGKNEYDCLNKTTDLYLLFAGGSINSSIAFGTTGHKKQTDTRFYICDKCLYSRDCKTLRQAKMIERLHKKKCKGKGK